MTPQGSLQLKSPDTNPITILWDEYDDAIVVLHANQTMRMSILDARQLSEGLNYILSAARR